MNKILVLIAFLCLISIDNYSQVLKWRTLPDSPNHGSRFEDCFFINPYTGWAVHLNGYIYKTTDAGKSWQMIYYNGVARFRSIGFFDENNGIAGLYTNPGTGVAPVYRTTNGGINWSSVSIPSPLPNGICGISIVNDSVMYGCGKIDGPGVVIKTTNKGLTWQSFNMTGLATRLVDCHFFTPDSGFVSGGIGSINSGQEIILFTSNGGINWVTKYTKAQTSTYAAIWKINVINRTILTGSFNHAADSLSYVKSTDGGMNWKRYAYSISSSYATQGIGFINSMTGWIGGDFSMQKTYETTDGGASWNVNDFGKGVNRIHFLSDTLGYAAGFRIYKYSRDSIIGISQIGQSIPLNYSLKQNYPNPFNPSTIIKFEVPKESFVKIIVYDLLGNEVAVIADEYLSAGIYQTVWEGKDTHGKPVSSGVYFCRIEASGYIQTQKMILSR